MSLEQRLWRLRQRIVWRRKQSAARLTGRNARYYGGTGTIHGTTYISIELDRHGAVVSCWYRCQMLPHKVTVVRDERAAEMRAAFATTRLPDITGIELHESVMPDHESALDGCRDYDSAEQYWTGLRPVPKDLRKPDDGI